MEPKVHCRVHKSPPLDQINSVHSLTPYVCKIRSNNRPFTLGSPSCFLLIIVYDLPHACYMPRPFDPCFLCGNRQNLPASIKLSRKVSAGFPLLPFILLFTRRQRFRNPLTQLADTSHRHPSALQQEGDSDIQPA
jgi:hypothetical protein